jgi:hypothetical protein
MVYIYYLQVENLTSTNIAGLNYIESRGISRYKTLLLMNENELIISEYNTYWEV